MFVGSPKPPIAAMPLIKISTNVSLSLEAKRGLAAALTELFTSEIKVVPYAPLPLFRVADLNPYRCIGVSCSHVGMPASISVPPCVYADCYCSHARASGGG